MNFLQCIEKVDCSHCSFILRVSLIITIILIWRKNQSVKKATKY